MERLPSHHTARMAAAAHSVNMTEFGILKVFIDYKVFDLIPDEGDISISELTQKIGGQQSLVERFSNFLVTKGLLSSTCPGNVAHTTVSRGYRTGEIASLLIVHLFNFHLSSIASWSEYFDKHGLQEPKQANIIPLGLAMGFPDHDFYSLLKTNSTKEKLFNLFLSRIAELVSLKGLYDFSWVKSLISTPQITEAMSPIQEVYRETPVIVDIGGGKGQNLKAILSDYPYIPPSRCVLFDRSVVIEENKRDIDESLRAVQLVEGDMFQKQPIEGAIVYHISRVLNDWPDDDCIQILKHISKACMPYSRVLIVEELLMPDSTPMNLTQDIFMLSLGGKKRNERMFQELAIQAGLRVNGVFTNEGSRCGVIELVLA